MTWFSDHFFWLPAEGKYESSIHLYVNDGWDIRLDMDDCTAKEYFACCCEHNCGINDTALRSLSLQQLKDLRDAASKAIEFLEKKPPSLKERLLKCLNWK